MKSLGVVRKLDPLGRVVIPMELRKTFGWSDKTPLEIYVEGERVILGKYEPGCTICGESEVGESFVTTTYHTIHGKRICSECASEIVKSAG